MSNRIFLFVLSPPYSGSTLLWRFLSTSPNVSALHTEGQFVEEVKPIMRADPWSPKTRLPWTEIKSVWESYWDEDKLIWLEKSPSNLIKAFEIEGIFDPAYFVIMIRNPYAFCEGYHRRDGHSFRKSAEFWVFCAETVLQNIKNLTRATFFTYEQFVEDPVSVREQLISFLPELQSLDVDQNFQTRSILGPTTKTITNMNSLKIGQLSVENISEINSVLKTRPDLMAQLGYEFMESEQHFFLSHLSARLILFILKNWGRYKRALKRRIKRFS